MPACVDALLLEADASGFLGEAVETVFIGGGTPSLLPPEELTRLLKGLRTRFDWAADAEVTSEANPGTLTEKWLEAAVSCGVNRLSLGMQAAQTELLTLLGRIHTPEQAAESVRMAKAAGIRNLNLDLMFGLPTQTESQWRETLETALALVPQHLSCYGLIPEEGTPLKADLDAGRLRLPEEESERRMYEDVRRRLGEAGFVHYEVSNFALPGYACRHNTGYWTRASYLGLGASAASLLPGADGRRSLRRTNPRELRDYLDMVRDKDWARRETETVSPEEARFETLMLGLRLLDGVSEADFLREHGVTLEAWRGPKLRELAERGLTEHAGGRWRLTRLGLDLMNTALVELM